jgi:hypothetical protein
MVAVDPIIDPALFDAVQARLKSRNPKQTPPRVVTGPILLTGLDLRQLRRRHDPAHWQVRPLPLLHLRPAGKVCLSGPVHPDPTGGRTFWSGL